MRNDELISVFYSSFIILHSSLLYGGGASRTHTGREARRLSTPLSYQLDDASKKVCVGEFDGRPETRTLEAVNSPAVFETVSSTRPDAFRKFHVWQGRRGLNVHRPMKDAGLER